MKCDAATCDHEASVRLRGRHGDFVTRWRRRCGCCARFCALFLELAGYTIEYDALESSVVKPDAVTWGDVEAAHDLLSAFEGPVERLFAEGR